MVAGKLTRRQIAQATMRSLLVVPLAPDADAKAIGNYGSFKIGSGTGIFGNAGTDGFGLVFGTNNVQVFQQGTNGNSASLANFTPATGLNHFDFLFVANAGNTLDTITFTINGQAYAPVTVGVGSNGTAAQAAIITLSDDVVGASTTFDNLSIVVPNVVAAPEPSAFALLGISGFGIAGTILRSRRNRRAI